MPIRELDPHETGAQFAVLPAVVRSRQQTAVTAGGINFYE